MAPALPAELVMIFDMSGSMQGESMKLLQDALEHVYTNLRPTDYLSMIRFGGHSSTDFTHWDKSTIESTGIDPFSMVDGGTNYDAAITGGVDLIGTLPGANDRSTQHSVSKQALFLTDGHPYPKNTADNSVNLAEKYPGLGFSFNALGLGDENTVDKPRLLTLTEVGRGQYFNANDPTELVAKLDKLLQLSKNVVYASLELTMVVFPGVEVNGVNVPVKALDILDQAGPGTHLLNLPDIEQGTSIEIQYEVKVAEPKPIGTVQEIIQWSVPGQPPVTSSIKWVAQNTAILADHNPRPTILGTVRDTMKAAKDGDTAKAMQLANTLTKIGETQGDPLATGIATKITDAQGSNVDIGEVLEDISSTKTNVDGTLKDD